MIQQENAKQKYKNFPRMPQKYTGIKKAITQIYQHQTKAAIPLYFLGSTEETANKQLQGEQKPISNRNESIPKKYTNIIQQYDKQ